MAIISMFYGIIISMYYLDNKRHNLPHIHMSSIKMKKPLFHFLMANY